MDPGDALFFHSNLLHSTGPNTSRMQRRALIVAFNQVFMLSHLVHRVILVQGSKYENIAITLFEESNM